MPDSRLKSVVLPVLGLPTRATVIRRAEMTGASTAAPVTFDGASLAIAQAAPRSVRRVRGPARVPPLSDEGSGDNRRGEFPWDRLMGQNRGLQAARLRRDPFRVTAAPDNRHPGSPRWRHADRYAADR